MDPEIILTGDCPWWADAARTARWRGRDVVVWLGPEVPPDDAMGLRLRERAAPWIGRAGEHLLPLLALAVVEGRLAWLYPPPDGASAAAITGREPDGWPVRPALELCGQVARALVSLGADGAQHPGPEPHHVLLSADGHVALSHVAGPGPRTPARREPRGRDDEVATVWRVGVLLAELLTGQPPQPATDLAAHDVSTRRLAIRLLARPGAPIPDVVRSWLTAMLAWEPADRPLLVRVGDELGALAAGLPGPDLAAFAAQRVPAARAAGPTALPEPLPAIDLPFDARPERTEEVVGLDKSFSSEEDTAVSLTGETTQARSLPPEAGTIPIGVGPPAELLQRRLRTPAPTGWRAASAPSPRPSNPPPPPPVVRFVPLLAGSIVGMALVGAITAWLYWR